MPTLLTQEMAFLGSTKRQQRSSVGASLHRAKSLILLKSLSSFYCNLLFLFSNNIVTVANPFGICHAREGRTRTLQFGLENWQTSFDVIYILASLYIFDFVLLRLLSSITKRGEHQQTNQNLVTNFDLSLLKFHFLNCEFPLLIKCSK